MRIFALFVLFLSVTLWACGPKVPAPSADLSPGEVRDWLAQNPKGQLVDVRTQEEFSQGHLLGARLLPLQELDKRSGEIDPDKPLLLYCHSGRRSRQAFELLKAKGFKDLHNMAGGIEAWKKEGLPVEASKAPGK